MRLSLLWEEVRFSLVLWAGILISEYSDIRFKVLDKPEPRPMPRHALRCRKAI
jgi:hypothetical protein